MTRATSPMPADVDNPHPDAQASPPNWPPPGSTPSSAEVLERLVGSQAFFGRYQVQDKIARGGQGAIFRVWDGDLRRHLAMKVLDKAGATSGGQVYDPRSLGRFLEEAQITGQLDHPGIVPIHELGLDSEGRVCFTMKLVRGRDLQQVFKEVHGGKGEWSLTRCLGVFIKVCETMAFAHAKGVLHRDLKPANIMVGRFGETYVMDWGLARVMGQHDPHDIRPRPEASLESKSIETARQLDREKSPGSPLFTADGVALGTPAYMPPEQAYGQIDRVGPQSDVYSVGAMLYKLLSGHVPYVPTGANLSPPTVLGFVIQGPPRPLLEIAPDAPVELVAIAEKAMARELEQRYHDLLEMARDLEAYLGKRPISAVEQRFGYLLRLTVQRNKPVALTLAGALSIVAVLLVFFILNLQASVKRTNAALRDKELLVDVLAAPALIQESTRLYPLLPERAPELESWLARADRIRSRGEGYRRELEFDRSGATEQAGLGELLDDIGELARLRPIVAANLDTARNLSETTIESERARWNEAGEDVARLEAYRGLGLAPQLGLVPLGHNRQSGLWEFWHVLSGSRPAWDDESGAGLEPGSGIVLVLLPGGPFRMGSPVGESGRQVNETQHLLVLEPFFVAKFEVTQAQWERAMGENPSGTRAGLPKPSATPVPGEASPEITVLHPVENVSWFESERFGMRLALQLPTEAQWEYACRAGTTARFCWGDADGSLEWNENIMDLSFGAPSGLSTTALWTDGYRYHAPVGTFAPNGFGLHDMHGNVAEWCRDFDVQPYPPDNTVPGDGLAPGGDERRRSFRGGSWYLPPGFCRSAFRQFDFPRSANFSRGLRLARELEPREEARPR